MKKFGGNMLRKAIDYFSHLAVDPKWYPEMTKDEVFVKTNYAQKLKWLKDDNEDIYDPDYSDMLRVAFMSQYPRGKMKDLVSLLQEEILKQRILRKLLQKIRLSAFL